MSHHFERLLEARCVENPDVAVLRAQWDFDKRLLTSALQAIAQTFPHYSRHDGSHSQTILIQIQRFLGKERLAKLSATDLWLLLEAAYYHDAGMIVTNAQLEGLWASDAFRRFLEDLRYSSDPDFVEASIRLLDAQKDPSRHLVDTNWPLQVVRAVRLVVADFRRRDHAARSADVVMNPNSVGLYSPRNDLIPDRLFRLLGRICQAHGQDFIDVMTLPYCEAGIAADIAHPRFVACMLRLGDLLDLDNGRFCPVMLSSMGTIPKSSRAHVSKHAAIRHLRIDPEVIEVEAECSIDDITSGGYEACASWLDWLKRELQSQQEQWTQIAPTRDFGALPSPGRIDTRLHSLTSMGRIEVDTERVPRLLRGANLYREPATFVREVLQNAVDATLLRVWHECSEEILKRPPAEAMEFAIAELKKHPIDVKIDRLEGGIKEALALWRFTINDHGAGINQHDVNRIRRIGQSNRDSTRRKMVATMPEWLRPSGVFGIGLQSLFLVTPEVLIDSRSFLDGKRRRLRLIRSGQSPASLLVGDDPDLNGRRFGTTVSFIMEFEKVPTRFSWSHSDAVTNRVLGDYDALVDRELPVHVAMIGDRVTAYASESWVPIRLSSVPVPLRAAEELWYFDANNSIRIRLVPSEKRSVRSELLYRGSFVKNILIGFPYYEITADVLAGTAEEILTIARDDLREDTADETIQKIRDASLAAIEAKVSELREKDPASPELPAASAALLISGSDRQQQHAGHEWKKAQIAASGVTFEAIAKLESFTLREDESSLDIRRAGGVSVGLEGSNATIAVASAGWARNLRRLAGRIGFAYSQIEECHRLISDLPKYEISPRVTRHSRSPIDPVASQVALMQLMEAALRIDGAGARCTIPCPDRYKALALSEDAPIGWMKDIEPDITPRLIVPFVFTHDRKIVVRHLRELILFVSKNARTPASRESTSLMYLDFVLEIDSLMNTNGKWSNAKHYNVNVVRAELENLANPLPGGIE